MGTAICIAIHMVRKQAHLRIYALRREDTRTKAALKAALERSEKTFSDYTRTEEDRRSLEKQFHEAQKMEAVGVLAGGIAHGMNNLLGSISAYASVILDETRKDDPRRRETEEILMAAKRGGQLTRNLLGFARKGKFQKSIIDMNDIIRQTIDMLKPSLPMAVNVDIGLGPTIPPNYGDPSQMAQALMNLCLNAADAMPDGGDLYLTTSQAEIAKDAPSPLGALSPGRYSVIRVSDTGQGMDEETRSQAFDPFFTTKGPDKGTGLGLAMVYGTVQSHGGHVFIDSTPNRGTSVTMYLPAATDEQIATTPPRETAIPSVSGNGPKCVLLVDDEPMIRAAGRRILKRLRCDVLLASNGADAIEVFENAPHPIDLVILDVAMPVMDGAECFYKLRNIDPKLPIVISSGFADQAHTEKLIADGANGILPKPYDLNQMSKLIEMDSADEAATEGRESG
jgi:two-component system cell cycle sensor histidine kinase/response regulator CckA